MDIQNSDEPWQITYHFVWGPMRSKACLVGDVASRLQALVAENSEGMSFQPLALIVLPDRVYLAAAAPPTLAPHRIVCQIKALTSRALREEFPELTRIPTLWTRAYLVLAGNELTAEEVIRRYEATLSPRRPRGRPRKTQPLPSESDDTSPSDK
jgi:putative transposase